MTKEVYTRHGLKMNWADAIDFAQRIGQYIPTLEQSNARVDCEFWTSTTYDEDIMQAYTNIGIESKQDLKEVVTVNKPDTSKNSISYRVGDEGFYNQNVK